MDDHVSMQEIEVLRRELYASFEEHIYTAEAGHNYRRIPDVARRIVAIDRLSQMASSASDRELREIAGILVSYIRSNLCSAPTRYPTTQEIVDEFDLANPKDMFGRKPRQRATLHRVRNLWLSRVRFRDVYASRALAILKHPDNQKIRDCIGEFENYRPQHGGKFSLSDLKDMDFSGFSLSASEMAGADLFHAKFVAADLSEADFWGAEMNFADLSHSSLAHASLDLASLRCARLDNADLSNTRLNFCYLGSASLIGAKMQVESLDGANLSGADLTAAKGLTEEKLSEAFGCSETKLPDHFLDWRPDHWHPTSIRSHRRRHVLHFEWLANREKV